MRPPREAHSQDRTIPPLPHYLRTVHPSDSSCIASPAGEILRTIGEVFPNERLAAASLFHSHEKGENAMALRADRRLPLATGATGCGLRAVSSCCQVCKPGDTNMKTGHLQLVPLPQSTTSAQNDDFRREGQPLGEVFSLKGRGINSFDNTEG